MHTGVGAREVPPLSGLIVQIVDAFILRSDARLRFDVAATRGINALRGDAIAGARSRAAQTTRVCRERTCARSALPVPSPHVAHGRLDRSFSACCHAICPENWKSGPDQAREPPMPLRVFAFLLVAVAAQAADLRT